jgi:2-polyprenyl-3-methyl-5-hydroxy-6-metoxy-1,4-benzoquinol methylase
LKSYISDERELITQQEFSETPVVLPSMIRSSTNDFPEFADIDTSSDDYARRFSGRVGSWFLKVQEEATLRMLEDYPRAKVLDVGGGHGQLTGALIRQDYRVTVLGSSEVCRLRINKFLEKNLCSFGVANILDLPYENESFDVVLSYRLLPHVTAWRKLISELARVAKKVVVVDYPSIRSLNTASPLLFGVKKRLEGNTRPFTCFRESQLLEVFESLRFTLSKKFPEFFLPMVFHRVLQSPRLSEVIERVCRYTGLTSLWGSPVILKLTRRSS